MALTGEASTNRSVRAALATIVCEEEREAVFFWELVDRLVLSSLAYLACGIIAVALS